MQICPPTMLTGNWVPIALDDGASETGATANYAGLPDTNIATNARFPDGDYTIHVIASDLLATSDLTHVVRLENFCPAVCASDLDGTIGRERIAHAASAASPAGLARERMIQLIRYADKIPAERDALYNVLQVYEN